MFVLLNLCEFRDLHVFLMEKLLWSPFLTTCFNHRFAKKLRKIFNGEYFPMYCISRNLRVVKKISNYTIYTNSFLKLLWSPFLTMCLFYLPL